MTSVSGIHIPNRLYIRLGRSNVISLTVGWVKFTGTDSIQSKVRNDHKVKHFTTIAQFLSSSLFCSFPLSKLTFSTSTFHLYCTDLENTQDVDFREFVTGMLNFKRPRDNSKNAFMKFAFRLFDLDSNGMLEKDEVLTSPHPLLRIFSESKQARTTAAPLCYCSSSAFYHSYLAPAYLL